MTQTYILFDEDAGVVDWIGSLEEFARANKDDDYVMGKVKALEMGEETSIRIGGGAGTHYFLTKEEG